MVSTFFNLAVLVCNVSACFSAAQGTMRKKKSPCQNNGICQTGLNCLQTIATNLPKMMIILKNF